MYPSSPTVTEWRRTGAANYRAKGGIVPAWYDGTDAASARLANEEPSAFAAVRYEMNAYAIANPAKFTPEHRALLAKQNGLFTSADAAASNYAPSKFTLGETVAKGASDTYHAVVDPVVEYAGEVKRYYGFGAVKEDPVNFTKLALLGVAVGAGLYLLTTNKKAA